jgi:hypothetical protein
MAIGCCQCATLLPWIRSRLVTSGWPRMSKSKRQQIKDLRSHWFSIVVQISGGAWHHLAPQPTPGYAMKQLIKLTPMETQPCWSFASAPTCSNSFRPAEPLNLFRTQRHGHQSASPEQSCPGQRWRGNPLAAGCNLGTPKEPSAQSINHRVHVTPCNLKACLCRTVPAFTGQPSSWISCAMWDEIHIIIDTQ